MAELFVLGYDKSLVERGVVTSIYRYLVLGRDRDIDHLAVLVADNLVDTILIGSNADKAVADNDILDSCASLSICYKAVERSLLLNSSAIDYYLLGLIPLTIVLFILLVILLVLLLLWRHRQTLLATPGRDRTNQSKR